MIYQEYEWPLHQAGPSVRPLRVHLAAPVDSPCDLDQTLSTSTIATVQDGPTDRLRVGPVIANDDPER